MSLLELSRATYRFLVSWKTKWLYKLGLSPKIFRYEVLRNVVRTEVPEKLEKVVFPALEVW